MIWGSQLRVSLGKVNLFVSSCCLLLWRREQSHCGWHLLFPGSSSLFLLPLLLCAHSGQKLRWRQRALSGQSFGLLTKRPWFTLNSESRKDSWGTELLPSLTHFLLTLALVMRSHHSNKQVTKTPLFQLRGLITHTKNSFPQLLTLVIR